MRFSVQNSTPKKQSIVKPNQSQIIKYKKRIVVERRNSIENHRSRKIKH